MIKIDMIAIVAVIIGGEAVGFILERAGWMCAAAALGIVFSYAVWFPLAELRNTRRGMIVLVCTAALAAAKGYLAWL